MKLIFDLDGTLICSKKRLHELFCDLVGCRYLGFEKYWGFKFSGKSNQSILKEQFNYNDDEVNLFVKNWMINIESDSYLEMDMLIDGAKDFLENISRTKDLYICTARQSFSQVNKQLVNLDIRNYFQNVFVTEQRITKDLLLTKSGLDFNLQDWMIGDTGHDVITGKKLGIKTCAVLSGFMSQEGLATYNPDIIISDITKFEF